MQYSVEFIIFIFLARVESVILSFEEHGMGSAVWFLTRLSTTETDIHITQINVPKKNSETQEFPN